MNDRKIGFYDYTVILTYTGMLFAYIGIIKVLDAAYWDALLCLMFAGLCDMFDGAVASTKLRNKREKNFGIQIDSLSDLISFGVLPAMFLYGITEHNRVAGVVGAIYVLCALIRLAYFNVLEEERQTHNPNGVKIYLGVPVTVIAVLLPIEYMMYEKGMIHNSFCFVVLLIVMSVGFLSPIEIKKPGLAGKVCLVVVGMAELIGLIFRAGINVL